MSHWNYRVVVGEDGEHAIHEAFYDDSGRLQGTTATPVYPRADSLEGLREELRSYLRALDEPVLKNGADEG